MGLKWFRARLSMKEETTKVPELTGVYRRSSDFELPISKYGKNMKYSEDSNRTFLIVNASMTNAMKNTNDNNETVECHHSKANFTSQSSSSIINLEESVTKDSDKKVQINMNDQAIKNVEPSTSTKDSTTKEQLISDEEIKKITNDKNYISDIKNPVCSDNELVI